MNELVGNDIKSRNVIKTIFTLLLADQTNNNEEDTREGNQSSEHDLSLMDTNKSNGAPRSQSSTGTVAAYLVNGMEDD
jgi:hypothetical protein